MSAPVSLTIRPPLSAPVRPSPLGRNGNGGWKAPSQRMFQDEADDDDDDGDIGGGRGVRRERKEDRIDAIGGRPSKKVEPLVIAPQPNRDWRQASQRRAPAYRPEAARDTDVVTHERTGGGPQRQGLRHVKREEFADDGTAIKAEPDAELADADVDATMPSAGGAAKPEHAPLSLDDEALQAILAGEHAVESDASRLRRELVIDSALDARHAAETDALTRDLATLPCESTLDDYAAVPVEAFGAAILRGMGYDPANDTKVHVPKPRPALLGIGATPGTELPGPPARKDAKKKREEYAKRGGRGYNAAQLLVRKESGVGADSTGESRDSREGSRRTSPESSDGKRRRDDDEYECRKSLKREDDSRGYRDDRDRRDRDRDRDGRDRRDRDDRDRRDRDSNRDDRDRRRDREYETDDERARRKAKERERERERDRDRDRDRGRERNGSGSGGDRRDRDRDDRDRDYERRR
ncbi:DNA primase large subunit Spp2 [Cryptotrichosporon argae]